MRTIEKQMPETLYRASRYFRVLGNPTAYMILKKLGRGCKTPSMLSKELNVSIHTISMTLRNLRQVNLVRYETNGNTKEYWVKDAGVTNLLKQAEEIADTMRKKKK